MSEWKPERVVDPDRARRLIEHQFPQLGPVAPVPVGSGWDNAVFQINGGWYFRFPQRQIAVAGVHREMQCLPILSNLLTGIARPEFLGQPEADFPWPFFGYRPIPGQELCAVDLSAKHRQFLARPVAQFLRKLHAAPIAQSVGPLLPADPLGRLDFSKRLAQTRERFARRKARYGTALPLVADQVDRVLDPTANWERLAPTAVAHGDFHFRHLILSGDAHLAGVIDWGDLHRNDPAVDLQIAWSLFPSVARREFWAEYGAVSEAQLTQSRALALFLALILFEYATEEKLDGVRREAGRSLEYLVQD
jgi:aminoglycoside phosphotransferase (APT) family kinase protein